MDFISIISSILGIVKDENNKTSARRCVAIAGSSSLIGMGITVINDGMASGNMQVFWGGIALCGIAAMFGGMMIFKGINPHLKVGQSPSENETSK